MHLISISVVLCLSYAAFAQTTSKTATSTPPVVDECVMNFEMFKSPLDASSKFYKSISPVQTDEKKKQIRQNAEFKTGEKVEFFGGGCAHLGYTFAYTNFKAATSSIIAQGGKALQLLEATPVNKTDSYKTTLVTALREFLKTTPTKNPEGIYTLACGDATCILNLHEKDKLSVSYDFAL